ncbi:MAG: hypothetical protein D8M57_06440 [Candidatus Scalindua sp. AMX11]|nr:MAG: hypothetical protein DWQ00_13955 [Candidatus Scalindua sp.]NOG85397.1 hypothetical protein [Planctomycetota bacterium]RZV83994.1 MAG: hypothetical protein EX341_08650 [Candidatus Scalindua sp. SCAELEC01]TDE65721.1 MAG: hypothetical protein D8M57_06440 [Candidatus Scalindua sp. AMX11]GJQ58785.1 MAG: hypothetical protein SCALA701_15860 [Candidatus Scalindua sp.]
MDLKKLRTKFVVSALMAGMLVPLSFSVNKSTFAKAAGDTPKDGLPVATASNAILGHGENQTKFVSGSIPRSVGSYKGYDLRKRDINNPDDKLFLDDVPGAASNQRIAAILRVGSNKHIEGGVAFGAEQFAKRVHDASFLILHDEDDDPATATLSVYAHGREHVFPISISGATDPNDHDPVKMKLDETMPQKDIAVKVYKAMQDAYNEHLAPRLVDEDVETKDSK